MGGRKRVADADLPARRKLALRQVLPARPEGVPAAAAGVRFGTGRVCPPQESADGFVEGAEVRRVAESAQTVCRAPQCV